MLFLQLVRRCPPIEFPIMECASPCLPRYVPPNLRRRATRCASRYPPEHSPEECDFFQGVRLVTRAYWDNQGGVGMHSARHCPLPQRASRARLVPLAQESVAASFVHAQASTMIYSSGTAGIHRRVSILHCPPQCMPVDRLSMPSVRSARGFSHTEDTCGHLDQPACSAG